MCEYVANLGRVGLSLQPVHVKKFFVRAEEIAQFPG